MEQTRLYDTLPQDHVRIVHFHCQSKDLCGTLSNIHLDDLYMLQYAVLSYACGTGVDRKSIILNTREVTIRSTLYNALLTLIPSIDTDIVSFWIDELCIDQSDEDEKGLQMRLMSKIYGEASAVIGWLGPASDDSALAIDVLQLYSTLDGAHAQSSVSEAKRDFLIQKMVRRGYLNNLQSLGNFFGPFGRPAQAVTSLLGREWFHRLWIVQEVALARRLVLRCGLKALTGDELFTAVKIRGFQYISDPPMAFLQAPYRNACYLGKLRDDVVAGTQLDLAHLAHMFCRWRSLKDVDRLNSLFGLSYRNNRDQALIKPSSILSAPALYKEFAAQSIRTSGGLILLHFAGISEVNISTKEIRLDIQDLAGDIPSWVPDWRTQSRPVHTLGVFNGGRPFRCTVTIPNFKIIDNGSGARSKDMLEVSAVRLDTIKKLCPVYLPSFNDHGSPSFLQWISFWYQEVQKCLPRGKIDDMFSSTLVMEGRLDLVEQCGETVKSAEASACFQQLKQWHFENFTEPSGARLDSMLEKALLFVSHAEELCRNRALFITQKGRLGLGSAYAAEGSSIYAIHGLTTPFVIDQRADRNILRGECYVNGIMDLELVRSEHDIRLVLN